MQIGEGMCVAIPRLSIDGSTKLLSSPGRHLRSKSEAPLKGRRASEHFAIFDVDSSDDEASAADGSVLAESGPLDLERLFEFNIDQLISVAHEATCSRLPGAAKHKPDKLGPSPRRSPSKNMARSPNKVACPSPDNPLTEQVTNLRQELELKDKQLERLRRVVCELLVWGTSGEGVPHVPSAACSGGPATPGRKRSKLRAQAPEFVSLGIPSLANLPLKTALRRTKSAAPVPLQQQRQGQCPVSPPPEMAPEVITAATPRPPAAAPGVFVAGPQMFVPVLLPEAACFSPAAQLLPFSRIRQPQLSNVNVPELPVPRDDSRPEQIGTAAEQACTDHIEAPDQPVSQDEPQPNQIGTAADQACTDHVEVPEQSVSQDKSHSDSEQTGTTVAEDPTPEHDLTAIAEPAGVLAAQDVSEEQPRIERRQSRVAFDQDAIKLSPRENRSSLGAQPPPRPPLPPQRQLPRIRLARSPSPDATCPTDGQAVESAMSAQHDTTKMSPLSPPERPPLDTAEWPLLAEVPHCGRKRPTRSRSRSSAPASAKAQVAPTKRR